MNPEAMQPQEIPSEMEQDSEKMLIEYLQELEARITALEEKEAGEKED